MKKVISLILSVLLFAYIMIPAFAVDAGTPFEDSRFFDYGEYRIHYRVLEAKEPVGQIFMIHGFALSSYSWIPLATQLAENGYTCVMADLPDFGYSTRETAKTEKLPREEIMHALMKDLSDDPWYLAGHSMGGYVALALAEKYPESVKNLLLYGTAGKTGTKLSNVLLKSNAVISRMGTFMDMMGKSNHLVRATLATALNDLSYALNYDISKITDPYKIKGTGVGAMYSLSMMPDTDFYSIPDMSPILYINGNKDNVISKDDREKLRGYLPEGSEDITVENGGHLFIENKASQVAEYTLSFLSKHKNEEQPIQKSDLPVVTKDTAIIKTGDTKLIVEAQRNALEIKSFSMIGGEELLKGKSEFPLPSGVQPKGALLKNVKWKFKNVDMAQKTENGVPVCTVTFHYENDRTDTGLDVTFLTRPQLDGPVEVRTYFINKSAKKITLTPGAFASLNVANTGEVVQIAKESGYAEGYHNPWDTNEYPGDGIYRTRLKYGDAPAVSWVTSFATAFNASGYLPMIYLTGDNGGMYVALEWSSGRVIAAPSKNNSLKFTVDMDEINKTNFKLREDNNQLVSTGVSGDPFKTYVPAGNTFEFPSVYIGAYNGSLDNGSNVFKHWFFNCKSPEKMREDPNEPLTQMDMRAGTDSLGSESLKWDYGWWTTLNNISIPGTSGWACEGSWVLRDEYQKGIIEDAGCSSMAEFGALLKSMGLNWTVYVLLHDTFDENGKPTDKYGEFNSVTHPDWFIGTEFYIPEMAYFADLGNKDCVEYLKDAMTHFFKDNNIGTWRSDFQPIAHVSPNENRHMANGSDVMYWCTYGFKEIVDTLYANVPDFRYESCSSGGGMKDLFTATKAVSINTDDSGSYLSLRTNFYDSSYVIPPAQLQLPASADEFDSPYGVRPNVITTAPEEYNISDKIRDMEYRSLLLGSPMYMCGPDQSRLDRVNFTKYMNMYKEKVRPLVREAELYHILPRPDGVNFDGVMYADPDTANDIKGLVFVFKPSEQPGNTVHLKLDGLYKDTVYQLSFEDHPEQNVTATGAELMSTGIDVSIEYVGSELIWIG